MKAWGTLCKRLCSTHRNPVGLVDHAQDPGRVHLCFPLLEAVLPWTSVKTAAVREVGIIVYSMHWRHLWSLRKSPSHAKLFISLSVNLSTSVIGMTKKTILHSYFLNGWSFFLLSILFPPAPLVVPSAGWNSEAGPRGINYISANLLVSFFFPSSTLLSNNFIQLNESI